MVKRHRKKKIFIESEPASNADFIVTDSNLAKAYSYYHEHHEIKNAREWIIQFLDSGSFDKNILQKINKLKDDRIPMWVCVHCRLMNAGKELPDNLYRKTIDRINELADSVVIVDKASEDVISEYGNHVIAYVETQLDELYNSGYKSDSHELYDYLKKNEIKQSDAKQVHEYYRDLYIELRLFESNKDVKEAYGHLTTKQRDNYTNFVGKILDDCKKYTETERKVRKTRKPRKKKIKPVDQIVSKVQFKTEDVELQLASINPTKIVGAPGVWVFNTKYRKLTLLQAPQGQCLSVKGTTIIGFDESVSSSKTIRKPKETLTQLLSLGKIAMKKEFEKIKTAKQVANGRIGKDTLILKVI